MPKDISGAAANAPKILGEELLRVDGNRIPAPRPYLVKNLLHRQAVSLLCGPSNTGKSCVVASLAAHIALGRPIAGQRVARMPVLFVGAEDPGGIRDRAHPVLALAEETPEAFFILPRSLNLLDDQQVTFFLEGLNQTLPIAPHVGVFIVFDTLNLCIGDGDENSARDMGQAVSAAQWISRQTGGHVMLVHHTGVQDQSRPRGSTAIRSNVDTLLVLKRTEAKNGEELVFLHQDKQRSMRKGGCVGFDLRAFQAGFDEDGELYSVPFAVPVDHAEPAVSPARPRQPSVAESRAAAVLDLLRGFAGERPAAWHPATAIGTAAAECPPFTAARDNPDSLRKAVKRALDDLVKCGAVAQGKGGYRLATPPNAASGTA